MDLWNDDEPIGDRFEDVDVPTWIEKDISPADVAAIIQGGCASGAYMPAVTYHTASQTMGEHGDEVLEYIENTFGELPEVPRGESWSGIACFYLSTAVEIWAANAADVLESIETEEEPDEAPTELRKLLSW